MIRRRIALGALLVTAVAGGIAVIAYLSLDRRSGQKLEGLQPRLDAIVDSGAPGVIALTRNGTHVRHLRVPPGEEDPSPEEASLAMNPPLGSPAPAQAELRLGS